MPEEGRAYRPCWRVLCRGGVGWWSSLRQPIQVPSLSLVTLPSLYLLRGSQKPDDPWWDTQAQIPFGTLAVYLQHITYLSALCCCCSVSFCCSFGHPAAEGIPASFLYLQLCLKPAITRRYGSFQCQGEPVEGQHPL